MVRCAVHSGLSKSTFIVISFSSLVANLCVLFGLISHSALRQPHYLTRSKEAEQGRCSGRIN